MKMLRTLLLILPLISSSQERREIKKELHCKILNNWSQIDTYNSLTNYFTKVSVKEDTAYPIYILKVVKYTPKHENRNSGRITHISVRPDVRRESDKYVSFFDCNSVGLSSDGVIERNMEIFIDAYDNYNRAIRIIDTDSLFIPIRIIKAGQQDNLIQDFIYQEKKPVVKKKSTQAKKK